VTFKYQVSWASLNIIKAKNNQTIHSLAQTTSTCLCCYYCLTSKLYHTVVDFSDCKKTQTWDTKV